MKGGTYHRPYLHELLIVHLHPAITIRVDPGNTALVSSIRKRSRAEGVPLERFRECFHNNACTNEAVECDARRRAVSIRRAGRCPEICIEPTVRHSRARAYRNSPYFCSSSDRRVGERL